MAQRKTEALSKLDHDELLALARRASKVPLYSKASVGDLINVIGRSLSVEEIKREVHQLAARRKWRKKWERRLASQRFILGLMVLVVVVTSSYVAWLGATPPQHYLIESWEKRWVNEGNTAFSAGTVDVDGNFYITGNSTGYFLAKFSPIGVEEWRRNFTVREGELVEVRSLAIDTGSGDIYVVGLSFGSGVRDATSFVIGFDSRGEAKWIRIWGSKNTAEQTVSRRGAVCTVGFTDTSGGEEAFLVRYDSDGNELWNATWEGNAPAHASAVAVDDEGNVFVTGYFNASHMPSVTDRYGFLVKYDSAGSEVWNATWSDEEEGEGRLVYVGDGHVYVLDTRYGLRKHNVENGAFIWRKPVEWTRVGNYGGVSITEGFYVETIGIDSDGGIIAGGVYWRSEDRNNSHTYSHAVCVAIFNSDGEKRMNITSPYHDGGLDPDTIVLQRDGSAYIVGWIYYPEVRDWEFVLQKFYVMDSFLAGASVSIGVASAICLILFLDWKTRQYPDA